MEKGIIIKALECHPEEMICAIVENKHTYFVTNAVVLSLIKELTEENERLSEDNEIKSQKRANIFEIINAFERGRADGVRKVQERLIAEIEQTPNANEHFINAWKSKIDQIAKEMLEKSE